jgi:hypothetical protein
MFWGFWTDEANTYWLACKGWHNALGRTLNFAGQPVLYSVIASMFCKEGAWRDFILRVPSVIAIAISAILLYHLAEIITGAGTGSFAALVLVCAPITIEVGTEARPYGLALCAIIAACFTLVTWIETGCRKWLLAYALTSVLVVYLHYLFAFCLLIFAVYPVLRGINLRRATEFACAELFVVVSLLPLHAHIALLVRESATFGKSILPTLELFVTLTFPPAVMLGVGLAFALVVALDRNPFRSPNPMNRANLIILLCWAFVGPAAFFVATWMTSRNIFTSRYLLFALPGFALLVAWFGSALREQRASIMVAIGIFSACVLNPLGLLQIFQGSPNEWSRPLAIARAESAPAFITSGLVESTVGDWQHGLAPENHFFGPLLAYPSPEMVLPLPYFLTESAYASVRHSLNTDLSNESRIMLVTRSDGDALPWFNTELASRRFRATTLYSRSMVVVRFDRN